MFEGFLQFPSQEGLGWDPDPGVHRTPGCRLPASHSFLHEGNARPNLLCTLSKLVAFAISFLPFPTSSLL